MCNDPQGDDDRGQAFEHALEQAAEAYTAGRSAAAERHIEQALELAEFVACPRALARTLALRVDPGLNVDDLWLGRFDLAWERLGSEPSTLAVELARSQVYAIYLSDPDAGVTLAAKAQDMAERLDDPAAHVAALDAQRLSAARADSLDPLIEAGRGLLGIGRRGDEEAAAKGYEALIFAAMLTGDTESVDRHLAAYSTLAAGNGTPRHRQTVTGAMNLLDIVRGDLDTARARVGESIATALSIGDSLGIQMAFAQQAMIALEAGEPANVMTVSREQLEANPQLRWWRLGALLTACRPGNEAEVADHLDCLLPDHAAVDGWRFLWLGELVVLTDAAVLVGDTARAAVLRDALAPHGDRYATLATAVSVGSVWRPIAAVSALLGDDERADREYERADLANRRIGAMPWLGRGRLGHAVVLHRTGRRDEAASKVESVLATARRLGLARLEREAQAVRDDLGMGIGPARIVVGGLSTREAELLTEVAAGRSNRELADRFHVSVKTVERHLSNIYTKLGVANRAEAVAAAFTDRIDGPRPAPLRSVG